MKLVVQRVFKSDVKINGKTISRIGRGCLVFIGIKRGDSKKEVDYLVKKLCNLRVFADEDDKMNLTVKDVDGELLIVSQFTLYGDCSGGNRPSFTNAERSEIAEPLCEYFCEECSKNGINVQRGIFGADMKVSLLNDGPVTIILESK